VPEKKKEFLVVRHDATDDPTESVLALSDLVVLLGEQQKTCVLVAVLATLPRARKRITGSYLAQVMVEHGHVRACFITERETGINVLEGQAAFAALCMLEGVCWQVRLAGTPLSYGAHDPRALQAEEMPQTDPLMVVAGSIPYCLRPQTQEEERRLSRQHRNVLRLIDGYRTTGQIAHLLALTPEQFGTILHDLIDDTLIAFYT
jgi:hypothetical protein